MELVQLNLYHELLPHLGSDQFGHDICNGTAT
jgi:hypothetical protein